MISKTGEGGKLEAFLGQFVALITFFAFPMIQYGLLKKYSKREGRPELWYVRGRGFRLVIRNQPGKKTLSDIRYRVRIRNILPPTAGSDVATLIDIDVLEGTDPFLFPGNDQILFQFRLEYRKKEDALIVMRTDPTGMEVVHEWPFEDKTRIIVDYVANLENWFNFDVQIAKRVEIDGASLREMLGIVHRVEGNDPGLGDGGHIEIPTVRNVG
jgi:hypothetical protein